MDYQRRRGRRRRGDSLATLSIPNPSCEAQQPQSARQWCFTHGITSFLILSSLIGIIYLMLDYQCQSCSSKANANNLTTSVETISKHLNMIQDKFNELDVKISHLSKDLPKLKGQINTLEALMNTSMQKEMGWDPNLPYTLSNLDELLKNTVFYEGKNNSNKPLKCSKCLRKPIVTTTLKPITVDHD